MKKEEVIQKYNNESGSDAKGAKKHNAKVKKGTILLSFVVLTAIVIGFNFSDEENFSEAHEADETLVTLLYTGAPSATLKYTLSGIEHDYSEPFTVSKTEGTISISASIVSSGYTFIRWQDGQDKLISSTDSAQNILLSEYGDSVTFTAVMISDGNAVKINLESNPIGAPLSYSAGGLNPFAYSEPFYVIRSQSLTIIAGSNSPNVFFAWMQDQTVVSTNATTSVSRNGSEMTFTAFYYDST
ncbi:MAG: hypothetical protein LBR42_01715, partial [Candidatus Methanoplasma sp.]|nr:hypothetical protein [Candidatus Methanoplasma sp.]